MDLQYIINLFGRWYNDQPLSPAEADFIPLIISTCTVSVLLVVMLIWMAHLYQWGTHIKWFTEDLCHWFGWNIGSYNEKEEDQSKTAIHTHTKH